MLDLLDGFGQATWVLCCRNVTWTRIPAGPLRFEALWVGNLKGQKVPGPHAGGHQQVLGLLPAGNCCKPRWSVDVRRDADDLHGTTVARSLKKQGVVLSHMGPS
ncbi:unnamed protein product [Cladocopium goreaui]|uniref:Uncharacterized protein n=1 Tax=Cladocopium goreaui TaxID=2562237 RepID=A0A9P1GDL5_9DINO|nr:unnamed protein product [Cladocopium goreaui]